MLAFQGGCEQEQEEFAHHRHQVEVVLLYFNLKAGHLRLRRFFGSVLVFLLSDGLFEDVSDGGEFFEGRDNELVGHVWIFEDADGEVFDETAFEDRRGEGSIFEDRGSEGSVIVHGV